MFAVLVTTKTYVGEPITCFQPDHFVGNQVDYMNQICWVNNTYFWPYTENIPKEENFKKKITYYQWVGVILTCQAVIFYLPRGLWRLLSNKSGVAVATITDAAIECQRKPDSEAKDKVMKYMVNHMGQYLKEANRKYLLSSR